MSSQDVLRPGVVTHRGRHHNLQHRFEIVRTLGQGTYGKVKLAVERNTGAQYAIKTIKKSQINSEQDLARIRREIDIMATLNHPNIITVYEVFENNEKIILVLEHASGGELYDYINDKRGLYENEARKFFRQIVSAVHYLHKNGFVHRDLKLENIMLDGRGCVKIGDFGLANVYSFDQLLHTFCGSPLYASPEIVNGLPYHGPEVDCWSLGVLLYTLVYGAMPFDGSDFKKLRKQISEADYFEPARPADAAGLIQQLLTVNPARRATAEDVIHHWWINCGYKCSPVEDTTWGAPIDVKYYRRSRSIGESSVSGEESDCDSEKNESPCTENPKPLKGILKKSKDSLYGSSDPNNIFSDSGWSENVGESSQSEYSENVDVSCPNLSPEDDSNCRFSSDSLDVVQQELGEVALSSSQEEPGSIQILPGVAKDVFEPTRKPKRGILKNRSKATGADSGCVMEDPVLLGYFSKGECSDDVSQSSEQECWYETQDRTELGSNETLDSCETENSAVNEVGDEEEEEEYNMSDIEAILDDESDEADDNVDNDAADYNEINGEQVDNDDIDNDEVYDYVDDGAIHDSVVDDGELDEVNGVEVHCRKLVEEDPRTIYSENPSFVSQNTISLTGDVKHSSREPDDKNTPSMELASSACNSGISDISPICQTTSNSSDGKNPHTSTPARPIKGILKKNGRFSSSSSTEEVSLFKKCHSYGSQSSCSSGDILDFSYDSGTESEAFLNQCYPPRWKQPFQSNGCDKQSNEELDKIDTGEKIDLISQYGMQINSFASSEDEWLNQINMLGEAYYESNIHREAVTNDLFNVDEAREICTQALDIVDKVSQA